MAGPQPLCVGLSLVLPLLHCQSGPCGPGFPSLFPCCGSLRFPLSALGGKENGGKRIPFPSLCRHRVDRRPTALAPSPRAGLAITFGGNTFR